MAKKKNPQVYMDVCIDGDPAETMVFEVPCCFGSLACIFLDKAKSVEHLNFVSLAFP